MNDKCPIWGIDARVDPIENFKFVVHSERAGGPYIISRETELNLGYIVSLENSESSPEDGFSGRTRSLDKLKAKLTTWLIEQRRMGEMYPEIKIELIERMEHQPGMSIPERADKLLQYIARETSRIGEAVNLPLSDNSERNQSHEISILAHTESILISEVAYLSQYLESQGWLMKENSTGLMDEPDGSMITVKGYAHLDELKKVIVDSNQAFVAMWFDQSTDEAFNKGFYPGIKDAGYYPIRIDRKEHSNKICDEIIAEIRRSCFVVADFTHGDNGARGGVYYEAGFAHGLNIPVIFTCREGMLEDIHFDTRQYSHIVWSDPSDLRIKLRQRIQGDMSIPTK